MNNTENEIKSSSVTLQHQNKDLEQKIANLVKVLDGLNAYGSLDLDDYTIITDYLKGAFPNISALKEV